MDKERLKVGDRVFVNTKKGLYSGYIGTLKTILDGDSLSYGVQLDGQKIEQGFSDGEISLLKSKYHWKYGDNGVQEFYDTKVDGKYVLVFRVKADNNYDHWMCSIDNVMIENKTRNTYYRVRGRDVHCMLQGSPYYLIKKVEYCLKHNIREITG